MENNPVKNHLNKKLCPKDFASIRDGLIQYLAEKDPKVTKTNFDNPLMQAVLPYVKEYNPGWATLKDDDLSTSYTAIKGYYHSLRGQFRQVETLREKVKAYLELEDYDVEEDEEVDEPAPQTQIQSTPQQQPAGKRNISASCSTA